MWSVEGVIRECKVQILAIVAFFGNFELSSTCIIDSLLLVYTCNKPFGKLCDDYVYGVSMMHRNWISFY